MRAILIAAALVATTMPAYAAIDESLPLVARSSPLVAAKTAADCKALAEKTADRFGGVLKRLDELPPGVLEHAVLRTVEGCPVREVVYHGVTYWVQPTNQAVVMQLAPQPDFGSRVIRNH